MVENFIKGKGAELVKAPDQMLFVRMIEVEPKKKTVIKLTGNAEKESLSDEDFQGFHPHLAEVVIVGEGITFVKEGDIIAYRDTYRYAVERQIADRLYLSEEDEIVFRMTVGDVLAVCNQFRSYIKNGKVIKPYKK